LLKQNRACNGKTALEDAKVQLKNGKEQLAEFEDGESKFKQATQFLQKCSCKG